MIDYGYLMSIDFFALVLFYLVSLFLALKFINFFLVLLHKRITGSYPVNEVTLIPLLSDNILLILMLIWGYYILF